MVLEIAHKNPQGGNDVFQMTLGSFDSYYVTDDGTIVKNEGQFKFRFYKNEDTTPLTCFNGGTEDFYNIQLNDEYQEFVTAVNPRYAVQDSSLYTFITNFPLRPDPDVKYLLTNDIVYKGKMYYQGAYQNTGNGWQPITTEEYFFVETLNQIPGFTFDDLNVPTNARDADGNSLLYTDENNIWVDTGDYSDKINKDALNKKWFSLYLIVNNENTQEDGTGEVVTCEIEINNERL